MKRVIFISRSSLLQMIIYKCTNTLQLHTSLFTENRNTYKCKSYLNTKLIKVLGRLKLFMIFGFNEIMWHRLNKGLL
jgi:hypothetical protein